MPLKLRMPAFELPLIVPTFGTDTMSGSGANGQLQLGSTDLEPSLPHAPHSTPRLIANKERNDVRKIMLEH
jgi:hypothetical protein